ITLPICFGGWSTPPARSAANFGDQGNRGRPTPEALPHSRPCTRQSFEQVVLIRRHQHDRTLTTPCHRALLHGDDEPTPAGSSAGVTSVASFAGAVGNRLRTCLAVP